MRSNGNDYYIGVDLARLTIDDGRWKIDRALVGDVSLNLSKWHGFDFSVRKPASLTNPTIDQPWETSGVFREAGIQLDGKDVVYGFGRSKGLIIGGHFSIGINATEMSQTDVYRRTSDGMRNLRSYVEERYFIPWYKNISELLRKKLGF